ncbi:phage portal protein [Thermogutta sp.]|uniref:phage portal protein n=1 Tax=Thermogutta sp. TaxID=1962930 RepID=UPI003220904A
MLTLIDPKTTWPPPQWNNIYRLYALHDAWFSGDANRLAACYAQAVTIPNFEQFFNAFRTDNDHFWGRGLAARRRTMLHVPVAGDIAATSAALLFSEPPKIKVQDDGSLNARKAQARLDTIITEGHWRSKLIEAAEACAALGGIFLKINWDKTLASIPILSVVQPDQALPEFSHGILTAVTFWRVLDEAGDKVWRLLERHEPGRILTSLFLGTGAQLGTPVDLDSRDETAGMLPEVDTGLSGLAAVYVPNVRPNRWFRNDPRGKDLGQSDYLGAEGLMESLDETYSSLMRDIQLGKARIIAPRRFFQLMTSDDNKSLAFDLDREAYVAFEVMESPNSTLNDNIKLTQFEIRAEQHLTVALELLKRIYQTAGYSPQTFGLDITGQAESGTALMIRERKSLMTAAKKAEHWRVALERLAFIAQAIDAKYLGGGFTPVPVSVEMQDSVRGELSQVAQSIELLSRAGAVSKETMVRLLHPDWTHDQVESEVRRILEESGLAVPTGEF